mmetsp:Transcript_7394/g.16222  ORF Transcript_7394/g.16222 Transcript_7394/m.16222 type:complete len:918 (+) Transcript_7394:76-2829(+)
MGQSSSTPWEAVAAARSAAESANESAEKAEISRDAAESILDEIKELLQKHEESLRPQTPQSPPEQARGEAEEQAAASSSAAGQSMFARMFRRSATPQAAPQSPPQQQHSGERGAQTRGESDRKVRVDTAAARAHAVRLQARVEQLRASEHAAKASLRAAQLESNHAREREQEATSRARRSHEIVWCVGAFAFILGMVLGLGIGGAAGALSLFSPPEVVPMLEDGSGTLQQHAGKWGQENAAWHLDTSDTGPELFSAVAGITRELISLANLLHAVGSMALTAVYLFLLVTEYDSCEQEATVKARRAFGWTLSYMALLLVMGMTLSRRAERGGQILGGFLFCGVAVVAPVLTGLGLRGLDWRWSDPIVNDLGRQAVSLGNLEVNHARLALILMAAAMCGASISLYLVAGFPLLMVPANIGLYTFCITVLCQWFAKMRTFRCAGLLQPEVVSTLSFAVALLAVSISPVGHIGFPAPVRLSFLVSSMNALLVSAPIVILGVIERVVPRRSIQAGAGDLWVTVSVWKLFPFLEQLYHMLESVQGTAAFAVGATVYLLVWILVMTASLRMRLWACRPFSLLSVVALCAALPRQSVKWALAFKVPLGLWLLAVALFVENAGESMADPVLREVLGWLGPRPAPFLALFHSILQVSTINSAMLCLTAGIDSAHHEVGSNAWVLVGCAWLVGLMAVQSRSEARGSLPRFALSIWSAFFLMLGTRLAPAWSSLSTRALIFAASTRWAVMAVSIDSFPLGMTAAFLLGFTYLGLLGEGQELYRIRRSLISENNTMAEQAPRVVVLLLLSALILTSLVAEAKTPLTLGCFMFYILLTSAVAGKTAVSRALVVGSCGVATMLLADTVQECVGPVQMAATSFGEQLFGETLVASLRSDPPDMLLPRLLLRDLTALVSGQAGIDYGPAPSGEL